jgi:hypothetical protein
MVEGPDGQASTSDFDFYEDVDSKIPINTSPVMTPSVTPLMPLVHPHLRQLRGDLKMPSKKTTATGPARIVAGIRHSNCIAVAKRKSSGPLSTLPLKKARTTLQRTSADNNNNEEEEEEEEEEEFDKDGDQEEEDEPDGVALDVDQSDSEAQESRAYQAP